MIAAGTEAPELLLLSPDLSLIQKVSLPGIAKGAPLWGDDGKLYVLHREGLDVRDSQSLALHWSTSSETNLALGTFSASPSLDATRDGQGLPLPGLPGVLYAANDAGTLFAFIVDATRLEPTAPWPKEGHDARNSGNSGTSLAP